MMAFNMKLLKAEWDVNQQEEEKTQMLHDLAKDDGYVALKEPAEDREGWRHRWRTSETWATAEDLWSDAKLCKHE